MISPRTFLLQSTKTLLTPILLGQFPGLDFTFQWHLVTLEAFHLEVVLLALALALFSISVDSVKSSFIFSHPPSFPQPPTLSHTDTGTHTQGGEEIERKRQRSSQGTPFCFLLWCQKGKVSLQTENARNSRSWKHAETAGLFWKVYIKSFRFYTFKNVISWRLQRELHITLNLPFAPSDL